MRYFQIQFNLNELCLTFFSNTTIGIKLIDEGRVFNIPAENKSIVRDHLIFATEYIGQITCYEDELSFIENFGLDIIQIKEL